ncbi:hypothetical protein IWW38_001354 [Coemansia aciculifera]|uniref:Uncharacterized protein n=1 Tax=Coemansia aciculifera TaxID=417176 RepID=A0ACC1M7P0_9FUNG|nr:hypothetical protein IWW38_001354 [Coemansia aciculifera]
MYSVPFTVPASSTEFEFNSSSAELRRLSAGVDPSTIARHSAGTATNTAAASFEASRQQQIPPQLSHSHSFGQPQFPSTTSLSALAAPAHQMHLQNRLYSSDCAPESSLPSLATPASMQHPTMCPPAFSPMQQQQQQQQGFLQQQHGYLHQRELLFASPGAAAAVTAPVQLWMGDIEPWMDEDYIRLLWARMGEVVSVKPIRDRQTGAMANYCFLEFATHADAERFLALYNGKPLPDPSERLFRLNWATGMAAGFGSPGMPLGIGYSQPPSFAAPSLDSPGGMAVSGSNLGSVYPSALSLSASLDGPEYSLFVGDLAPEVTDVQLAHEFRSRYASVRTAKIVTDPVTLLSRGYGFVRFADEADQQSALAEMQSQVIGSRAIRVSTATPKRTPTMTSFQHQQQQYQAVDGALGRDGAGSPVPSESSSDSNALYNPATDPNNTTVFVGGLTHPVSEEELHNFFATYGDVVYCKIPPNRGCGFVTFSKRGPAETAMRSLNGHVLGGARVRLSWGRSQSHARHNHRHYHHHHHHHHHHRQQNSNGGNSSSGTNSHRNSVSDQQGLLSRRSVSLGKGIVAAAPSSSTGLGLGLSGASLTASSQHGPSNANANVEAVDEMPSHSATPAAYSASLSGHPTANNPHQMFTGYSMTPQQAFYTLSPIHSGGGSANEHPVQFGGYAQQQQQPSHFYYHHQQPQDQSMLATPVTAQGAMDLSPSVAAHFGRQSHGLAMRASGQFESMQSLQQGAYGPQHDFRGGGGGGDAIGTILPSLAGCPSELLTRRLSALALGSGHSPSASSISASSAMAPMPTLNRRPSAGVIGQRRLSSKSSFYVPPHKSSSQSSMAQMWPSSIEHSLTMPLPPQSSEVSTAASSARLSSSSLSYMAMTMTPSTLNSGDSRRQSSDDKHKRDSQDQLSLALDGDTIRAI